MDPVVRHAGHLARKCVQSASQVDPRQGEEVEIDEALAAASLADGDQLHAGDVEEGGEWHSEGRLKRRLQQSVGVVDFTSLAVSMTRNGELFIAGTMHAVMAGNPAASVAWLANRLFEEGAMLSAGMVVLTGAMAQGETVSAGDTFEADFGVLGQLGVGFRE